eukprot:scaffold2897_cov178-Amphora_coffeaeformis.AAC.20
MSELLLPHPPTIGFIGLTCELLRIFSWGAGGSTNESPIMELFSFSTKEHDGGIPGFGFRSIH